MPAIDATVGGATANSFASKAAADLYCDARSNATAWADADDDTTARALIDATRELTLLTWEGTRATVTQALAWPRLFALDPDKPDINRLGDIALLYFASTVVPQRVIDATCELAWQFVNAGTDLAAQDDSLALTALKVGPINLAFARASTRAQGLARYPRIVGLISPLLSTFAGNMELIRG